MADLMNTLVTWFTAISTYQKSDLYGFITAILQAFGFQGEWQGYTSMSEYADWIASMFGPLTGLYQLLLASIDTATFVEIVNKILAFLNK